MDKIQGANTIVTVVVHKDKSSLVQYVASGVLSRKYVPTYEIKGNMVSDEVLKCGIPYGHPWEEIELKFDSARFANEMHNVDIWTVEDAMKNPQKLWSALRATLADNLSTILVAARSEIKRSK
jgi:hypothetical protein